MVAFDGEDSVTEKLRVGSEPDGSRIGTVMFWAVSPAGKVKVPLSWV